MKRLLLALAVVTLPFAAVALSATPAQFSTPISEAIALLTTGVTPFTIVGIDASGYVNFGVDRSADGYGFRDNGGTMQVKDSGGSWSNFTTSGGAPSTATYILQTASGALPSAQATGDLGSALLINTTTTGVLSAYTGTVCTNQVLTALSALGVGTCASVSLSGAVSGTLPAANGGTGIASYAQGDVVYASGSSALAALAKSTSSTRYLSNTGSSNNPAWAQVALATGVSGTLPVANGGVGITSGTSGGVLAYTASGTLASSAALTANRIVLGGGAGAAPTIAASLGTTTTVLHGNAAGAPTFAAVNIGTDTTGTLGVAQGGTNIASYAVGDLIYASGSTTLAKLADVAAGSVLRAGGITTAPAWSTTIWPNAATTGDLLQATGANTYGNLTAVAAGSFLRSGGVATVSSWSTTVFPNSATTGDVIYASGANTYANLAAVATGRVLASGGTGTAPSWLTNVPATTFIASTAFVGPGTVAAAGDLRLANAGLIAARNAADGGDITLIQATSGDFVQLGSSNAAGIQAVAGTGTARWRLTTPTISSGFGTTPSIAGTASAFKVTVGSGGDTTGVVLFASTWPSAPVCTANNQTTAQLERAIPTTTQVTVSGTMAASDVVAVMCVGY